MVAGTSRCSMEDKEKATDFTKTGPDGEGWVLLANATEVQAFCKDHPKLYHQRLAEHSAKHVCAYFGTWGFAEGGQTNGVVFLRYEFRGGLRAAKPGEVFDPTGMVGIFGHDLYKEYNKISKKRPCHVWQRAQHGEIALDFCVG